MYRPQNDAVPSTIYHQDNLRRHQSSLLYNNTMNRSSASSNSNDSYTDISLQDQTDQSGRNSTGTDFSSRQPFSAQYSVNAFSPLAISPICSSENGNSVHNYEYQPYKLFPEKENYVTKSNHSSIISTTKLSHMDERFDVTRINSWPESANYTKRNCVPTNFSNPATLSPHKLATSPIFPSSYESKSSTSSEFPVTKMCTFCRRNGENPLVYTTHNLKERFGKMRIVTCPILRNYVCPQCKATGDKSHTVSYCPKTRALPKHQTTMKNSKVN